MAAPTKTLLLVAGILAGCAPQTTAVPTTDSAVTHLSVVPSVVQKGKGAQWVTFKPRTAGPVYAPIVLGADNEVWFIDWSAGGLVRIGESGAIKEFSLSSVLKAKAVSLAVGADRDFYVLDDSTNVVRVNENGAAKSFPIPSGDNTSFDGVAPGPDGNVWFSEFDHIGKITPAGKITEFKYPSGYSANNYGGVTSGSDGNVWFAQSTGNAIGRIVPSTGAITMFPIGVSCTPAAVLLANDNNVWFACLTTSPLIGRITPKGKITTFPIGGTFGSNETEQFCARGPDGNPWCASVNDGNIFSVSTKTQKVTTFTPPLGSAVRPDALTAGADGNVWVDTLDGQIAVLVTNPMTVKPIKLTFSRTAEMQKLSVSESGVSSWSAESSNVAVATVVQGGSAASFKVTSVGVGKCKVTIADDVGNSVAVKVTVL